MKQIINNYYKIGSSHTLVRRQDKILFEELDPDLPKRLHKEQQKLLNIYKYRNKFYVEGIVPKNSEVDVDEHYLESGDPIFMPNQMEERMFNVIRFNRLNGQI